MPMYQSWIPVLISIWVGLFLGGIMLPIYQGVMLENVEDHLKAKSMSLAQLSYNLLGWLPAPVIYGWICEATGGKKSRWGMTFHVNSIFVTLLCVFIGLVA